MRGLTDAERMLVQRSARHRCQNRRVEILGADQSIVWKLHDRGLIGDCGCSEEGKVATITPLGRLALQCDALARSTVGSDAAGWS